MLTKKLGLGAGSRILYCLFVLLGLAWLCGGGPVWADEGEVQPEESGLPHAEHILILDVSGSMGSARPEWGQYGSFKEGFTSDYCRFWQELLAPEDGFLYGEDAAVLFPCSYYGKREEQRRDLYAQLSEGLTLRQVAESLQRRDAQGNALCPGPDSDGAMGPEGMLTGLREAMDEAKTRGKAPLHFYWFLTDNGFDDSSEKLPEAFYNFLSYNGEPSFAQVWFAPLRRLPGGRGDLVLYLAVQEDKPGTWRPEWSEALIDNVLNPRLNAMWPGEEFKRRFVDLRGTIFADDGVALVASAKDFQRCLVPIPAEPFEGKDRWCSVSRVPIATGEQALKLVLMDNHAAAKSGYENAVSVRCKVRPPKGWNICNINAPHGQSYTCVSSVSPDEEQILKDGLRIEFGQAPTVTKGSWRGTKPIVWTVVANDKARDVVEKHSEGVDIELLLCLPTTIDFSRLSDEQQSGLDQELFSQIANLDRLERFILRVAPDEMVVEREWIGDKPVFMRLSVAEQNLWQQWKNGGLPAVARGLGEKLAQGAAPGSAAAKLSESLQGAKGGGILAWLLLGLLLLLAALIALAVYLHRRSKGTAQAPKKKKQNDSDEEDLDYLSGGDDDA